MGLRLSRGVDLVEVRERYGVDVWAEYGGRLERFIEAGLLRHEPGRLAAAILRIIEREGPSLSRRAVGRTA